MATSRLQLTRDQLASFLQDHEQIKQFERLFALVDALQPTTLNDLAITAGNADQKAVEALDALNRIATALELLATAPVIRNDNSVVTDYIDFNVGAPDSAVNVGRLHWNGGYTLNLDMTPNVNQAVGESQYYYIKASGAITKGQLIMFDGAVGSSGVLQGKPATGVTNGQLIMGVAAESIPLNGFGLISSFGLVRGFNTSGAPYGETWADGDILYYNPSFAGGLTKTQPLAPVPHVVVAAVVNAATGGSGSVFVRVQAEPLVSQLSDVYVTSLAGNDILVYDGVDMRWENRAPTAARDALGLGTGNPSNGQMLIGNGTDFTTAALTAGTGISVTNGVGSATIATNLAAGANISITGATTQTIAVTGLGTMAFQNTGISATITTAKLTAGGANGSMTFTNGILTAQTQAT
jgi:hypothetical protein